MSTAAPDTTFDIAIVGSGFAGSLLAMIARRLGRSVLLLERGTHPRTVIGESSTPLTNLLLEEMATRYDLPRIQPFTKWGAWQRTYPDVACGLKRGFTFYHHDLQNPSVPDREHQLLVAASPHDAIADTHWYRADFDHAFVREAQNLGVEYRDHVELHSAEPHADHIQLEGTRLGRPLQIRAKFVVDATGPRGFLHRALKLNAAALPNFPQTQALYSHFSGVKRLDQGIIRANPATPYPIDDAAVHHVFDGGWIWVLQFNNGLTSAGVAATDEAFQTLGLSRGAEAWDKLLHRIPILRRQFSHAHATLPFTPIPRLSFRSATIAGDRWALLPSAAGFVDPLLSTGFPLTLLGVARLAEILETSWESPQLGQRLQTYAAQTDADLQAAARLISSLYSSMGNFPLFASLSLLYFAAVSYAESARRLNKPHLAPSFLLHDHPQFGPASAALLAHAHQVNSPAEARALSEEIVRTIEPFNVAGLGDPTRRNWYPVDAEDLFSAGAKLQSTRPELERLLDRAGFWPCGHRTSRPLLR